MVEPELNQDSVRYQDPRSDTFPIALESYAGLAFVLCLLPSLEVTAS